MTATKRLHIFTAEEIRRFLLEAPDADFLAIKTVTVFGVFGAYWGLDLTNLCVDNVTDYGTEISVRISDSNTKRLKEYSISQTFADIVRKYMKLRPAQKMTNRLFLQYRDGKCIGQHIGKQGIVRMPRIIAEYLGMPDLDDPVRYSGHSFRNIASISNKLKKPASQTSHTQLVQGGTFYLISTDQQILLRSSAIQSHSPNLRITHEDGQEFESDEYILSDTNRYNSGDIHIKTEDETVHHSPDFNSEHQDGNQDNDDVISVNSSSSSLSEHDIKFEDIFSSEPNANQTVQSTDDTELSILNASKESVQPIVSDKSHQSPNFQLNEEFEAGNYFLNGYTSHDNRVETVHRTSDYSSEDNTHGNLDDDDIISVNSNSTLSEHDVELEETLSESKPNKKVKYSRDIDVTISAHTSCENSLLCQQKTRAQAEEITRLKQLVETQKSKIESLESLLLDDLQLKLKS